MKKTIIYSLSTFILGLLMGGAAILYYSGPRIAPELRAMQMSTAVQLAARTNISSQGDEVLCAALSRIKRYTIIAQSDLHRGSHIELSENSLRFAKAFYTYTDRAVQ